MGPQQCVCSSDYFWLDWRMGPVSLVVTQWPNSGKQTTTTGVNCRSIYKNVFVACMLPQINGLMLSYTRGFVLHWRFTYWTIVHRLVRMLLLYNWSDHDELNGRSIFSCRSGGWLSRRLRASIHYADWRLTARSRIEAVRLGFGMIVSLWNLTGTSTGACQISDRLVKSKPESLNFET